MVFSINKGSFNFKIVSGRLSQFVMSSVARNMRSLKKWRKEK